MEDAVRHVAQAFTRVVGAVDPRLNSFGTLDFSLHSLFHQAWKRADPPPSCIKPLPMSVVRHAHKMVLAQPPHSSLAASGDCLLLA